MDVEFDRRIVSSAGEFLSRVTVVTPMLNDYFARKLWVETVIAGIDLETADQLVEAYKQRFASEEHATPKPNEPE